MKVVSGNPRRTLVGGVTRHTRHQELSSQMAAESTPFSSSGEDAINRGVLMTHTAGTSNVPNPITREELAFVEDLYEVQWTAMEIEKAEYRQVE
jgi:hypothetical protein